VNIILLRSQNLFCKTNKAFWLYLTKYFVSNPNPNNRIRVTRFQQPGTRLLNRVISQLTSLRRGNTTESRSSLLQQTRHVANFSSCSQLDVIKTSPVNGLYVSGVLNPLAVTEMPAAKDHHPHTLYWWTDRLVSTPYSVYLRYGTLKKIGTVSAQCPYRQQRV